MNKAEFTGKCGELLNMANSDLVKCEYKKGSDLDPKKHNKYPDDEFVLITCKNGYNYLINVTCNSLMGIASAIFNEMKYK